MRKLALLLALLGILILLLIMQFSPPKEISSQKQISPLKNNQKVSVQGAVIEDKPLKDSRLIILNNNISIYCDCSNIQKLKGKNISVLGIISTFQYSRIKALKIKIN